MSQRAFRIDGDAPAATWSVPVCVRFDATPAPRTHCEVLSTAESSFTLETQRCPRWILPNPGSAGHYWSRLPGPRLQALLAARSHRDAMAAARTRWQSGLGSLLELEEARRQTLQADTSLAALRRDRVVAWIALYRALGGGWSNQPDSGADPEKTALPTNRTPS